MYYRNKKTIHGDDNDLKQHVMSDESIMSLTCGDFQHFLQIKRTDA